MVRTRMPVLLVLLLAAMCFPLLSAAQPPGVRPAPPTRPADAPDAPRFTAVDATPGSNAPVDAEGDFLIGPDYVAAPELEVTDGVPQGSLQPFVPDSRESRFYPGIARDAFGTLDPNKPRTLIVDTHPQDYERTITVYIPVQYECGASAPFIVSHDGPRFGSRDMSLPRVLDNLIAAQRVPTMIAIMIQNGGGDAQGGERGLEWVWRD